MYKVTVENKTDGTTRVFDELESMMLVMLSENADDVVFENEFVDDVKHEERTFGLLSLAQGYVFAGLAEYRKMVKDKTHNDILAQKSLDFMQDLVVKRAQEIKKEVFVE
jgi:hypothetical protein